MPLMPVALLQPTGPTGLELAYAEFTSDVTITSTTNTGDAVVSAPAISLDGFTPICIEFYSFAGSPPGGATGVYAMLHQNGASIGDIALVYGSGVVTMYGQRYLTPSAGSHTFAIRGKVTSGTGVINAGVGGASNELPGFIRITKVMPVALVQGQGGIGAAYRRTASDQTGTGSVWNAFTGDTTDYDDGSLIDVGRTRFTAPVAGIYLLSFTIYTTGAGIFGFQKNGSLIARTGNAEQGRIMSMTAKLAAADFIEPVFFSSLTTDRSTAVPAAAMELLRAT